MEQNNLSKRLFTFSVKTIKFLRTLPYETEYKVIRYQLIKSATSSGANYEEAQAESSRADFTNKVRIALREMRESNYWLRLIDRICGSELDKNELTVLVNESNKLKYILGAIITKMRKS